MGAVDLVVQIESPPSVASALQRVGRAGHQVGEISRGVLFPKHRGDLVPSAVTVERMRTGRDRGAARADQPARRARPAGRRGHVAGHLARRRALRRRTPRRAVRLPAAQRLRRDAGPALRPLPERRVRRAAAAPGLGPRLRRAHRPAGRAAARGHQRRHHPRPRAVRRLPGRREDVTGRRARRGDGLRVARRRRVHAGHHQLAHRGHHPRPGAGLPRPRPARPAARSGPATRWVARRARRGHRAVHPRGRRDATRAGDRARDRAPGSTSGRPTTWSR